MQARETIKIVLLGTQNVGKTALLNQFKNGQFSQKSIHTIGVDFISNVATYGELDYNITYWDTAGQERWNAIGSHYLRSAHAVIIVYDLTNAASFHGIHQWIQMAEECNAPVLLLGNKCDLQTQQRAITMEKAMELANKHGFLFAETSAKTGEHVRKSFLQVEAAAVRHFRQTKRTHEMKRLTSLPNMSSYLVQAPTKKVACNSCASNIHVVVE